MIAEKEKMTKQIQIRKKIRRRFSKLKNIFKNDLEVNLKNYFKELRINSQDDIELTSILTESITRKSSKRKRKQSLTKNKSSSKFSKKMKIKKKKV